MSGVLRTGVHGYSGPGVIPVTAMGGGAATAGYFQKVLATGPLVYFPQWEAAGVVSDELVNSWNGAYTGVTLGQPGIGDGNTSPWFDGANDFNDLFTAAYQAAFNGSEGTFAAWARVNAAAVWTDGITRGIFQTRANATNRILLYKAAGNNTFTFYYQAGGVVSTLSVAPYSPITWFHVAITWSASTPPTGEVRCFLDGTQQGATMVGLGAWAGAPVANATIIGALFTTPSNIWHGWLAHGAIWTRALTPGEIWNLSRI